MFLFSFENRLNPQQAIFYLNINGSLKNTVEVSEIGRRRMANGRQLATPVPKPRWKPRGQGVFSTKNILLRNFSNNLNN